MRWFRERLLRRWVKPVPLSTEAEQRLARLGFVSDAARAHFQNIFQWDGEEAFWRTIEREEASANQRRVWLPRLRDYVAECRRRTPIPEVGGFSALEREQHRILLDRMSRDRDVASSNRTTMLATTRVGLAAATETFRNTDAVILEESEQRRWLTEICPTDDAMPWWQQFAWWTLTEGLEGANVGYIRKNYPIPLACAHWIVSYGIQWGSLMGGDTEELWLWDGDRAVHLADLFSCNF